MLKQIEEPQTQATSPEKENAKGVAHYKNLYLANKNLLELCCVLTIIIGMPIYLGVPLASKYTVFKAMFIISVPLCVFDGMSMAANDICNAVGTTYGARIMTMKRCLYMACVFEIIGCLTMGDAVSNTIIRGIVNPDDYIDMPEYYIIGMIAVLAGAPFMIIVCTIYGLPVSITKGTVFGLLTVGLTTLGFVEPWGIWKCVIGLIVSPILGAFVSCILHLILIITVKKVENPQKAALVVQPIIGGFCVFVLITFILFLGLKIKPFYLDVLIGLAVGVVAMIVLFIIVNKIKKPEQEEEQNAVESNPPQTQQVVATVQNSPKLRAAAKLFEPLVVLAACFMSFAHGANDVGNAIGPMCGIFQVWQNDNSIPAVIVIPFWTLLVGAASHCIGILVAGERTMVTLGDKITNFDAIKAFAAQLGSSFAVLVACACKVPVSTSHVTFGAVCGASLADKITKLPYEIDMGKVKSIILVWFVKIPISMFAVSFIYYEYKGIFIGYTGFDSEL